VGELGLNLLVGGISSYLLFFYTEVFGITAAAAGSLILVARVWDAVNDPIMGAVVDRTHSRWGQSRPYILFAAAPVAILTVLTFTTPPLGAGGKLAWAYTTFILWGMAFTALAVPYNTLMANLTTDSVERTSIGAVKTIFAVIGSLLVIVLAKPMTQAIGSNLQTGYTGTFAVFAVLAFIMFIVCFRLTEERPSQPVAEKLDKRQLANITKNRELMILLGFFLLFQVAFSLFRTIELYYFKYVLLRDGWFAAAMLMAHLVAIGSMALTPTLAKRLGKKGAALLGGMIGSLFLLLMVLTPHHPWLSIAGISASYFFLSVPYVLFYGMVPDTVEYGQWKTGVRSAGLIFSVFTFTQKLGMALAAALASWGLERSGYVAEQMQNSSMEHGILLMRTLVPALLVVLGMALFLFYRLGRDHHQRILTNLGMRKT
jgi:sugar (glycoside-pentoside-hexuronide) transporter